MGSLIFEFLDKWVSLLFIFTKILFNLHQIWRFSYFSFIKFQTNAILSSIYLTTTLLDIYSLYAYFSNSINAVVYYCFMFVSPFAFYFLLHILFTKMKEKISSNLSHQALKDFSLEENPEQNQSIISKFNILQDRKTIRYL